LHPGVETVVGSDSLEPTERARGRTVWQLDRVVGQRGIALDLPPGRSPLGRILLMCQLAGGAVLLFGIGFWYLSEGVRPGRLDTFRWGHFLLLALNHVAFFAVFAVIALRAEAVVAIAVAAALSQALLVLHASRIASTAFALARVLPLSLFTLGLVTATVYAGEQRPVVIAGAAMAVVAYVTVTYRRWSAGRDAHRKDVRQRAQAAARGRALDEAIDEVRREHGDASDAVLAAGSALSVAGDQHAQLTEHLRTATAALAHTLAELQPSALRGDAPDEDALAQRLRVIRHAGERIAIERAAVDTAARALAQTRRDAELRAHRGDVAHCISCGEPGDAAAAHCPRCGVARPVQRTCTRCGRGAELPHHFMRRSALRARLHCAGCGDALPAVSG
jgi:hypothetical protein